ncbi:EF-Tu C-terminal domain-related protein [Streptomyces rimosus]|uniref:EF-Tu C-terminal domain-related protein n=1 Tax=Streptomyces rimosus TaxID=1927 RepID=UPI0037A51620
MSSAGGHDRRTAAAWRQGGRGRAWPGSRGARVDFYVRAAAVRGVVTLPHGVDVLRPLHTATVTVALERPVALEESQAFAFRHHGRAAGSGTVTRLLRQFPGVSR